MNYSDDPLIQRELAHSKIRRGLWLNSLLWMPLFLITAAALIYFAIDVFFGLDRGGTVFLLFVLGFLALLFGFQGIQSVLDLRAQPARMEGFVTRRWAKSDSLVMRTHYIRLGRKHIFRIDKLLHGDAKEGDYVSIEYYPHSAVVLQLDRMEAPEGAELAEVIIHRGSSSSSPKEGPITRGR